MATGLIRRALWHLPVQWQTTLDGWRCGMVDLAPQLACRVPSHAFRLAALRWLGVRIGWQSSIHRGCRFYQAARLEIGSHCVINQDVILDARSGLQIGDNVSISEQVAIYTLEHDIDDPDFRTVGSPVVIEDYVYIGARALLLPGVRVGRGAVVAAGAVVTGDVPPYTLVAGVPARVIRERTRDLRYQLNYRRTFF